ncbi:MAG: Transcriptional regulator [Mucilaginibacter sp.]|nr:Transcriptional regulator [Mucilaginibacter sp.]
MNGKIVYVLEDDADISELIAYILSEAGYVVKECESVSRFNEALNDHLPDIFILDILLPDGNGLDICQKLRNDDSTGGIPVLMMSAHKTKKDIEALGCGADFIAKPFDIDKFRETVDQFA